MNVPEAIEILIKHSELNLVDKNPDLKAASLLGIQALIRIRYQRRKPTVPHKTLLPGETEAKHD